MQDSGSEKYKTPWSFFRKCDYFEVPRLTVLQEKEQLKETVTLALSQKARYSNPNVQISLLFVLVQPISAWSMEIFHQYILGYLAEIQVPYPY